jgi:hypothetical protein
MTPSVPTAVVAAVAVSIKDALLAPALMGAVVEVIPVGSPVKVTAGTAAAKLLRARSTVTLTELPGFNAGSAGEMVKEGPASLASVAGFVASDEAASVFAASEGSPESTPASGTLASLASLVSLASVASRVLSARAASCPESLTVPSV